MKELQKLILFSKNYDITSKRIMDFLCKLNFMEQQLA